MSTKRLRYPPPAPEQALLVGHLMASAPSKTRGANAASTALSLAAHTLVLVLAFSITTDTRGAPPPDRGIPIVLRPDPKPSPPLPLPPAIKDAGPQEATVAVNGPIYRTLNAPIIEPTDIPAPSAVSPTEEWLYGDARGTDIGNARPVAGGTGGPGSDPMDNPNAFIPMSVAPELSNRAAVERALLRLYPAMLRDAGIGGRVVVWVFVDENGGVMKAVVRQGSGYPQLDAAALDVARVMRFRPAMNQDQRIRVWVSVPVQFRTGD